MPATVKPLRTLVAILLCSLAGCQSVPSGVVPTRDATLGLTRHPQFAAAAQHAPAFVEEAFRVITRYESELALLNSK